MKLKKGERLKDIEAVCNPVISKVYGQSVGEAGGAGGAEVDGAAATGGDDDYSHDEL